MSGGKLLVLDPSAAAVGTFTLYWQQPNTGVHRALGRRLVGADWQRLDGVPTVCRQLGAGLAPRMGLHLAARWASRGLACCHGLRCCLAPLRWARWRAPALGKVPASATDVRLPHRGHCAARLGAGVTARVELPVSTNLGLVVDGVQFGFGSSSTNNFSVLTPTGAIVGSFVGCARVLGREHAADERRPGVGRRYKGATTAVVALQVNSLATPTPALRFTAPGVSGGQHQFAELHTAGGRAPPAARMSTLDTNLTGLGYATRMLSGLPVASGATLTQWGTQGGDSQHRASLKVTARQPERGCGSPCFERGCSVLKQLEAGD